MVAPESKMPKTVFGTVVLEVSTLQLKVKLFNVGGGHRHLQRPTRARCFSDPPMVLARVACLLWLGGSRREGRCDCCAILQHRNSRRNNNYHFSSDELRGAAGFRGPCLDRLDWLGRVRAGRGEVRQLARVFGAGLVSSGRRCNGEIKVCHNPLDLLLGGTAQYCSIFGEKRSQKTSDLA